MLGHSKLGSPGTQQLLVSAVVDLLAAEGLDEANSSKGGLCYFQLDDLASQQSGADNLAWERRLPAATICTVVGQMVHYCHPG